MWCCILVIVGAPNPAIGDVARDVALEAVS